MPGRLGWRKILLIAMSVALLTALVGGTVHIVGSALKTRRVVLNCRSGGGVSELGGPERTCSRLSLYLRLPDWIAPKKSDAVIWILGSCGRPAVCVLVPLLDHSDMKMRHAAATALRNIGSDAKDAASSLVNLVRNEKNTELRSLAAEALGRIGPEAKIAVPALREAMAGLNPFAKVAAALALWRINSGDEEALQELVRLLGDHDSNVRHYAAMALKEIGPQARTAVAALMDCLSDDNDDLTQGGAAAALGAIGPEAKEAVPALIKLTQKKDSWVPSSAVAALGGIGPEAKDAVPVLLELLEKYPVGVIRVNVFDALGGIGVVSEKVITALTKALVDPAPDIRASAARALGKLGMGDEKILSALSSLLGDSEEQVRQAAAEALARLGDGLAAIAVLAQNLKSQEWPIPGVPWQPPCAQNVRKCAQEGGCGNTNSLGANELRTQWRRGRDSNPRYPGGYTGFRNRPIRPLWHLSAVSSSPRPRAARRRTRSGCRRTRARDTRPRSARDG